MGTASSDAAAAGGGIAPRGWSVLDVSAVGEPLPYESAAVVSGGVASWASGRGPAAAAAVLILDTAPPAPTPPAGLGHAPGRESLAALRRWRSSRGAAEPRLRSDRTSILRRASLLDADRQAEPPCGATAGAGSAGEVPAPPLPRASRASLLLVTAVVPEMASLGGGGGSVPLELVAAAGAARRSDVVSLGAMLEGRAGDAASLADVARRLPLDAEGVSESLGPAGARDALGGEARVAAASERVARAVRGGRRALTSSDAARRGEASVAGLLRRSGNKGAEAARQSLGAASLALRRAVRGGATRVAGRGAAAAWSGDAPAVAALAEAEAALRASTGLASLGDVTAVAVCRAVAEALNADRATGSLVDMALLRGHGWGGPAVGEAAAGGGVAAPTPAGATPAPAGSAPSPRAGGFAASLRGMLSAASSPGASASSKPAVVAGRALLELLTSPGPESKDGAAARAAAALPPRVARALGSGPALAARGCLCRMAVPLATCGAVGVSSAQALLDTERDVTVIDGDEFRGEGSAEAVLRKLRLTVAEALQTAEGGVGADGGAGGEEEGAGSGGAVDAAALGVLKASCRTATGADALFLCRALFGHGAVVSPSSGGGVWAAERGEDGGAGGGSGAVQIAADASTGTVRIRACNAFDVFAPEQVGQGRSRAETDASGEEDVEEDGDVPSWRGSPWVRVTVTVEETGSLVTGARERWVCVSHA